MGEDKADVRDWPAETHGSRPAELVVPESAKRLHGIHRGDDLARKQHFSPCCRYAVAKFVIICEQLSDRLKATDALNPTFCCDNRCAKRKVKTLSALRDQHSGGKIGRSAECFDLGKYIRLHDTSIEAGHRSRHVVRERGDHVAKIIWADTNVAVGNHHDLVARFTCHKRQIVYLTIFAKEWGARKDPDFSFGILSNKCPYNLQSGIGLFIGGK